MQRIISLFLVLTLCHCQGSKESKSQLNVAQLLDTYQKLPLQYQGLDFTELLLLKPIAQKVKLNQALDAAKKWQAIDSLYFDFLGQPFSNFIQSTVARTDIPSMNGDSVEIMIRYSEALTTIVEAYHIGITGLRFKRFVIDRNCNPNIGPKPLTSKCLSVLAQKNLPTNPDNFAEIKDYLEKCDFYGFPARFNIFCMDGDYITIYLKDDDRYQAVYAHCPDEQHPLRIILNKVKYLLKFEWIFLFLMNKKQNIIFIFVN